jgi:LruC domain-containing protein
VLDLPANWQHPIESQDIAKAYPDFINWLNTPAEYANWYKQNIKSQFIFDDE